MAKILTESQLSSRASRAIFDKKTYWRGIDPDTHLGYRKAARGGHWVVRWYRGAGDYEQATLAKADDAFPANGVDVLDFTQAIREAKNFVSARRQECLAQSDGPALCVSDAIHAYLIKREKREKAQLGSEALKRDARSRLAKYVLAYPLSALALHELHENHLQNWRRSLPERLAPTTILRLIGDLKAALNDAASQYRRKLPADFALIIKEGLKLSEPREANARRQILNEEEVKRLILAARHVDIAGRWEGDLYHLILLLAATGARFSQIRRLLVSDLQIDACRVMIPTSRKGAGGKRVEKIAVPLSEEVIIELAPLIKGRASRAPLLERWRHTQISPMEWSRERRGPWNHASEMTRPWAQIIEQSGLFFPNDTLLPYALRHSSIVRGLRAGLPTRLVAALHDTSVLMIEKHYAAYVVDALHELAARAVMRIF